MEMYPERTESRPKPFKAERGSALIMAIVLVVVAAMLVISYFVLVRTQHAKVDLSAKLLKAKKLAESGSDLALKDLKAALASNAAFTVTGEVTVDGFPIDFLVRDLGAENPDLIYMMIDVDGIKSFHNTYEIITTAKYEDVEAWADQLAKDVCNATD